MSLDSLRNDLSRLRREETQIKDDLAKQEAIVVSARAEANKRRGQAATTKSASLQRSYLRQADTADKKMQTANGRVVQVSERLRKKQDAIAAKEKSIRTTQASAQKIEDRQADQRRRIDLAHAKELSRLAVPEIRYVPIRQPQREKLRVLYLTSSPSTSSAYLRVDKEFREVRKALYAARYREHVELIHVPAAEPSDILNELNYHRPHVVHFSGHGGGGAILMDGNGPNDSAGQEISLQLLGEAMRATTTKPMLLVLNACDTIVDAESVIATVPAIIAMTESISDEAAIAFATQFYSAIASAQSLGAALDQARIAITMRGMEDESLTPRCLAREDLDLERYILVEP